MLAIESAGAESDRESAADWSLGRRNRALAELRCACFGPSLEGWTACEDCGEKLEFQVDGSALVANDAPPDDVRIRSHGRVFRLPTSRDLARIAGERDPGVAAIRLVERCTVSSGAEPATREWTEEEVYAIGETMALADPLAEILLHFDCPTCHRSFDQSLDLTAFVWLEIEGRAKRLLREVHTLASAYGWSEAEVLSLSSARRALYLDMVRA